jgi:oligopeptide/dipeptide ABC transporter ATP-binding protein
VTALLEVDGLRTVFPLREGTVRAVDGVSFKLEAGETLGIVGESGCGKSVTALSIMRLLQPPGRIASGSIRFKGKDLTKVSEQEMIEIRGEEIAMIFQDPMTSLNPVFRIGGQVSEPLELHKGFRAADAWKQAVALLGKVGIPVPQRRAHDYPHQFSGGMRQRAMIAMGLATAPAILIADEPTTALDVTIQAQILELLKQVNQEYGTATILITHNLGVVAGMCERVLVMYAGKIVESGRTREVMKSPQHPYTWSLLRSLPRLDAEGHERLLAIEGSPPDLVDPPAGCRFHPRCPFAIERCAKEEPPLETVRGRLAACWVTQAGRQLG